MKKTVNFNSNNSTSIRNNFLGASSKMDANFAVQYIFNKAADYAFANIIVSAITSNNNQKAEICMNNKENCKNQFKNASNFKDLHSKLSSWVKKNKQFLGDEHVTESSTKALANELALVLARFLAVDRETGVLHTNIKQGFEDEFNKTFTKMLPTSTKAAQEVKNIKIAPQVKVVEKVAEVKAEPKVKAKAEPKKAAAKKPAAKKAEAKKSAAKKAVAKKAAAKKPVAKKTSKKADKKVVKATSSTKSRKDSKAKAVKSVKAKLKVQSKSSKAVKKGGTTAEKLKSTNKNRGKTR